MTVAAGRHVTLVFPTGLRRWAPPLSRLLFWIACRVPAMTRPLGKLQVIHVVRWTIIERWPGDSSRPVTPILLFEGDFDGDLQLYIDSFAEIPILRLLMWAVWSSSYGFPRVVPTERFHEWVTTHDASAGHFYTAFPAVAPSTIASGLALDDTVERFATEVDGVDDDDFARCWPAFLRQAQVWL